MWCGTALLAAGIAAIVAFGNNAVERLFRDVSDHLYAIYALFIVLALWRFGNAVPAGFAANPKRPVGHSQGLQLYSGYNIVGAVVILPVLRHLLSDRDA